MQEKALYIKSQLFFLQNRSYLQITLSIKKRYVTNKISSVLYLLEFSFLTSI